MASEECKAEYTTYFGVRIFTCGQNPRTGADQLKDAFSVEDFRKRAKNFLPKMVFDYLEGGSEGEAGLSRNVNAFGKWNFVPRRLTDVSECSLETTLLGKGYSLPFYLSPTGLNGLIRPDGDRLLAQAAAKAGIPFVLSTASNLSIEDIAASGDGERWFQLYVLHRDIAKTMCQRALTAGYEALILTVDVPVNGYRERDMRNRFALPATYGLRTLADGFMHPRWSINFLRSGTPKLRNFETLEAPSPEAQAALMKRQMDASFDWDALRRLREWWPKKLMVKGVLRAEDAVQCAACGVDALIVSNHGARQLDGTISPLEVLAEIASSVQIPILLDSGIRRGADALTSLCLGATTVGLGRATLYALASDGQRGVERCLEILTDELKRGMALLGASNITQLDHTLVRRSNWA
ncbi:mandelate dehydrogenase [Rhizobium vallis]|uniref:Mandelate dehydrogenase n=1 Tax=Rhizobium vallis TaxID=634290 RepID=A0A432PFC6_9HYPH|nr:mandelate dehydrogenase [Rhizobium vallis]